MMTDYVLDLLKEAKPYYFKKKRQKQVIASTLGMVLLVFCVSFNSYERQYTQEDLDTIAFGSVISDYGFDVDEFGLLNV